MNQKPSDQPSSSTNGRNGWILCPSKSFSGKFYYFNVATGEAAWCLNENDKSRFQKRDANFPSFQPRSPELDFDSSHTSNSTNLNSKPIYTPQSTHVNYELQYKDVHPQFYAPVFPKYMPFQEPFGYQPVPYWGMPNQMFYRPGFPVAAMTPPPIVTVSQNADQIKKKTKDKNTQTLPRESPITVQTSVPLNKRPVNAGVELDGPEPIQRKKILVLSVDTQTDNNSQLSEQTLFEAKPTTIASKENCKFERKREIIVENTDSKSSGVLPVHKMKQRVESNFPKPDTSVPFLNGFNEITSSTEIGGKINESNTTAGKITEKESINSVKEPVNVTNIGENDLRHFLLAKRRKSAQTKAEIVVKKQEVKPSQSSAPKKKVSFQFDSLRDLDDVSQSQDSFTTDSGHKQNAPNSATSPPEDDQLSTKLRHLISKSLQTISSPWYLVVDLHVLIEEFTLLQNLVTAVEESSVDNVTSGINIVECCREIIRSGHYAILVTNNMEVHNKAKDVDCLTVQELKEYIAQKKRGIFDLTTIKIVVKNEAAKSAERKDNTVSFKPIVEKANLFPTNTTEDASTTSMEIQDNISQKEFVMRAKFQNTIDAQTSPIVFKRPILPTNNNLSNKKPILIDNNTFYSVSSEIGSDIQMESLNLKDVTANTDFSDVKNPSVHSFRKNTGKIREKENNMKATDKNVSVNLDSSKENIPYENWRRKNSRLGTNDPENVNVMSVTNNDVEKNGNATKYCTPTKKKVSYDVWKLRNGKIKGNNEDASDKAMDIEEGTKSQVFKKTTNNKSNNQQCDSNNNPNGKGIDEELKDFFEKYDVEGENFDLRQEEGMCCFFQIMEDVLSEFLQSKIEKLKQTPPPWYLSDATECIEKCFERDAAIKTACEALSDAIIPDSKSCDLVKAIGCGLILLQRLKRIDPSNLSLTEAVTALEELIVTLKTPLKDPDLPVVTRIMDRSDSQSIDFNKVIVKKPSEVIEYLKRHYSAWKSYTEPVDYTQKNTQVEAITSEECKIVRTCGRDLKNLKIHATRQMTVEKTLKNDANDTKTLNDDIKVYDTGNTFRTNDENDDISNLKVVRNVNIIDEFEKRFQQKSQVDMDVLDYSEMSENNENLEGNNSLIAKDLELSEITSSSGVEKMEELEKQIDNRNDNEIMIQSDNEKMIQSDNEIIIRNDNEIMIRNDNEIMRNDNEKMISDSDKPVQDDKMSDSGIENEAAQAECIVKNFFVCYRDAFLDLNNFILKAKIEMENGVLKKKRKYALGDEVRRRQIHLKELMECLSKIIRREKDENTLQILLKKAGSNCKDIQLTRYRQVVTKCLEQFDILKQALNVISEYINGAKDSDNIVDETKELNGGYLNIFET